MADNIFNRGQVEAVYYDMGIFSNDAKRKYIRAPFSVLKLDGQQYVIPLDISGGAGNPGPNLVGLTGNDEGEELNLGRAEFYHTLEIHRVGMHEFGNWKGDDNWRGMFRLGLL